MRELKWILTAAVGLGALAPAIAEAQSSRGVMGAQSRASVGIVVSVMPRFNVERVKDAQPGKSAAASPASDRLRIASNAPSLRYSLLDCPPAPQGAVPAPERSLLPPATVHRCASPPESKARLLLVVPD